MNLTVVEKAFDYLNDAWQGHKTHQLYSNLLIFLFIGILLFGVISSFFLKPDASHFNYFLAIEVAFSALLIFEILGLIFVLPRSVADSVGKQFEILSIILLRSAFKEFSHLVPPFFQTEIEWMNLLPMLSDAFGGLIIFLIIGFYYIKQKHERITENEDQQHRFIAFKKFLALLLLISFLTVGIWDIYHIINTGHYEPSFNTFYTFLIFSDLLILLYSLRYHSHYVNVFRYSSFAFATVIVRLSLSAPTYINVLLGICAGVFVLGLTIAYNHFRKISPK